jgi:hypothetical protein
LVDWLKYWPGLAEESCKRPHSGSQSSGQSLNLVVPEYETGVLSTALLLPFVHVSEIFSFCSFALGCNVNHLANFHEIWHGRYATSDYSSSSGRFVML